MKRSAVGLSTGVAEHIVVADLKAKGISNFTSPSRIGWSIYKPQPKTAPMSLIIDDKRMPLARWPNADEHSPYMVYKHYLREDRALRGYEKRFKRSLIKPAFLAMLATYLLLTQVTRQNINHLARVALSKSRLIALNTGTSQTMCSLMVY